MDVINIEIKARIDEGQYEIIKNFLDQHHTSFKGIDRQADYYFNVPNGRLKLRIGNVEQSLIYYDRSEDTPLKTSRIKLYKPVDTPEDLLDILETAYGIKVKVIKERMIYFIDHIKFHLDTLEGIGRFCEIEAISTKGQYSKNELSKSCQKYIDMFGIVDQMIMNQSYSDMVMNMD